MPKQIKKENVQLGVIEYSTDTTSYINLYKALENITNLTEEKFRQVFNEVDFVEEVGYEYNSQPIEVSWAYIPVISDGILNVKILKLEQGTGIVIVLPEQVATAYKEIEEDINKINVLNQNIDLVGDVYGMDETDKELTELIKTLYTNVGANAPAFELTKDGEVLKSEDEENKELNDDKDSSNRPSINAGLQKDNKFSDLGSDNDLDLDIPELDINAEAYKRVSKDTDAVETLLTTLFEQTPVAVRKHVKTLVPKDTNVVTLFVDNKAIYETFNTLPKHARKQISQIGETIRLNENTQLLDSFKYKDGRAFVIAENSHKNIWRVKNEEIKQFVEKNAKTLYISEKNDIIELEQSNIKVESRKYVERKDGDRTLFIIK